MLAKHLLLAVLMCWASQANAENFSFFREVSNVCGFKNVKVKGGTLSDYICKGATHAIDTDSGSTYYCEYLEQDWYLNSLFYKQVQRSARCVKWFTNAIDSSSDTTAYHTDTYVSLPVEYLEERASRRRTLIWRAKKDQSSISVCYEIGRSDIRM